MPERPTERDAPTPLASAPAAKDREKKPPADSESFRDKLILAIIVAVLSFGGASAGTLISGRLEIEKWRRETKYNSAQAIFNKRIDLIDRTVRIFNKAIAVKAVNTDLQSTLKLATARSLESLGSKKPTYKNAEFRSDMDHIIQSRSQLSDSIAEFSSLTSLDSLFFGPKTVTAIGELRKSYKEDDWWNADHTAMQAVLNAMGEELKLNIE